MTLKMFHVQSARKNVSRPGWDRTRDLVTSRARIRLSYGNMSLEGNAVSRFVSHMTLLFQDTSKLNLDVPEFSSCFLDTVLVWAPCAFLWIYSPFFILYLQKCKRYTPLPFSVLNISKSVRYYFLSFFLFFLSFFLSFFLHYFISLYYFILFFVLFYFIYINK